MSSTSLLDSVKNFVGIDVSKDWIDCYLRPKQEAIHCGNNPDGFTELEQWLSAHGADMDTTIICMENTGIYGDKLLKHLTENGWICAVEKTTVLEKVTPDHHRKDDQFDAAGLAEYADRYLDKITITHPKSDDVERLRQLYSERNRLVIQKGAVQNKCSQLDHHTVTSERVAESLKQQLNFYQHQIDQIEQRMHELVRDHQGLHHYWQLLMEIPGIGKVTAWLWLVQFYGQPTLDCKKIASRFGFAPHSKRSGSSMHGKTRSSGHGAAQMRKCMSLAARAASTYYEKFRLYKQRKMDEGKIWPVVRNNLINKLIKIICAIWNSGQPYRSDHTSRYDRQKVVN
jgi:transposase